MKAVCQKLRGTLVIIYAVGHVLFFTIPGFLIAFVSAAILSCGDGKTFRYIVTKHTTWHGAVLSRHLFRLLRIRLVVTPFPIECLQEVAGFIIIANHQSITDIPFLCYVMWRFKLTSLRWILKESLRWSPFGWAAMLTKCGFVKRHKAGKEDLASVAACGTVANADGASVVIFPDGTRKDVYVRPRIGGFVALLETMPGAPILSLTFHWEGHQEGQRKGRGILDASDLIGRSLYISAEHHSRTEVDADPDWLNKHWEQKRMLIISSWAGPSC